MNMDFCTNITPMEVIKDEAFGETYFRGIYSSVNGTWYRKSSKEFNEVKNIDKRYYCSNCYDVNVNKYRVKCGTSLRFWENNGWILMVGFSGILDIG